MNKSGSKKNIIVAFINNVERIMVYFLFCLEIERLIEGKTSQFFFILRKDCFNSTWSLKEHCWNSELFFFKKENF